MHIINIDYLIVHVQKNLIKVQSYYYVHQIYMVRQVV